MGDATIKIEKLVNGFAVEYRDPDIVKANREPGTPSKNATPWRNPSREMAFKSAKEVAKFLETHLDKLCQADEYDTGFSTALMEGSSDD